MKRRTSLRGFRRSNKRYWRGAFLVMLFPGSILYWACGDEGRLSSEIVLQIQIDNGRVTWKDRDMRRFQESNGPVRVQIVDANGKILLEDNARNIDDLWIQADLRMFMALRDVDDALDKLSDQVHADSGDVMETMLKTQEIMNHLPSIPTFREQSKSERDSIFASIWKIMEKHK